MNTLAVLADLAEKTGLLAAAAVFAVLVPPLRKRVLGVGRRRDKLAGMILGLGIGIWGATLGFPFQGVDVNLRAIGIFIAAILGGLKSGVVVGFGCGLFHASRLSAQAAPWALATSLLDGFVAGWLSKYFPRAFRGWRVFPTCVAIQLVHVAVIGPGVVMYGEAPVFLPALPAHALQILTNAIGVSFFTAVARLVLAREDAAVAMVKAQTAAQTAELSVLRGRLEPHFLFNALNALRATIRTNPPRARELVSDLADLYRYILSHPDDATLGEELAHARAYLDIEKARLGDDHLHVEVNADTETCAVRVPALLLQPLVENAVKHSIAQTPLGGRIAIGARLEHGMLTLTVQDERASVASRPLPQPQPSLASTGIGLRSLRQRLQVTYGDRADLELSPTANGCTVTVRIPLATRALSALQRLTTGARENAPIQPNPLQPSRAV